MISAFLYAHALTLELVVIRRARPFLKFRIGSTGTTVKFS